MIQEALTVNVSQSFKSILFILCVLAIMIYISPPLTGVTFVAIVPIILLAIVFGNMMRKVQRTIQATKAKMSEVAEESFANIRTVKAFSNEAEESVKFIKGNAETYNMSLIKA